MSDLNKENSKVIVIFNKQGSSISKGFHNLARLPFYFCKGSSIMQGFFDVERVSQPYKAPFRFRKDSSMSKGVYNLTRLPFDFVRIL